MIGERFEACLQFVLLWEGGYVNHPLDRGGPTNRGITQATYDDWRVRSGFGRSPVVGISGDEVRSIYRDRYWLPVRGDRLPEPVDLVVFDAAVNCGPKQAILFLQRAIGVPDDGQIGPVTLHSIKTHAYPPQHIAMDIIDQRDSFYARLIAGDSRQAVFERGWRRRLDALRDAVR